MILSGDLKTQSSWDRHSTHSLLLIHDPCTYGYQIAHTEIGKRIGLDLIWDIFGGVFSNLRNLVTK